MTLEGWTTVMYNYYDSSGLISVFFFPLLVVIGTFFILNLFLAVIMETFSDTDKMQKEKEERRKRREAARLEKLMGPSKKVNKMIEINK